MYLDFKTGTLRYVESPFFAVERVFFGVESP